MLTSLSTLFNIWIEWQKQFMVYFTIRFHWKNKTHNLWDWTTFKRWIIKTSLKNNGNLLLWILKFEPISANVSGFLSNRNFGCTAKSAFIIGSFALELLLTLQIACFSCHGLNLVIGIKPIPSVLKKLDRVCLKILQLLLSLCCFVNENWGVPVYIVLKGLSHHLIHDIKDIKFPFSL